MRLIYLFTFLILNFSKTGFSHSTNADNGVKHLKWTFQGVLGYYDRASLKRGFQVYNEVCAACHSMNLLTYRKLKDIGLSDSEVKSIAATKTVHDGPNDDGQMFDRNGRPADKFSSPYPNKKAAIAANGAYPPDLSLATKAYAHNGGADYVYSILTGYEETPNGFSMPDGKYYNKYFDGYIISMPPPLTSDDLVTYSDNTTATIDQMARDVSNFLQWAAEPELEDRKKMGFKFMVFLILATIISFIIKKRIWRDIK
jgi:ubiquinol-cytochrome c reductase cytochrome c1 subunit